MSRLSEAEEYKKATKASVTIAGFKKDIVTAEAIVNTELRCLLLLAEIADMLEEIKVGVNSYSDPTVYADNRPWVIPERSEE